MNLYDELIEQKLLCLLNSMQSVSFNVQIEDFYFDKHKKIYRAFLDGVFDLSAETDALKYGVDQLSFFKCLEVNEFSFSSLKPLEGKISELATRRRKVEEYNVAIKQMMDPTYEVVSDSIPVSQNREEAKADIIEHWNNRERLELAQLSALTDKMYTFSPGHVMLLAGTSGTGKTNFAIQLAEDISYKQNEQWLFMSLEMNKASVAERCAKIFYYECNPDGNRYHSNLFFEQNKGVEGFYEKVMPENMNICDKSGLTIKQISSIVKFEVGKNPKIKTVVIDYAQLIRGAGNIFEKLTTISEMAPYIAKTYGVRVVLLCQLTKDSYDNSRPSPSSIKGSGALFDNADVVLCLYKDKEIENNRKLEIMHWKDRYSGSEGITNLTLNGLHLVSGWKE